jgi:hypothetical protein
MMVLALRSSFVLTSDGSLTRRRILWEGSESFTSVPKEGRELLVPDPKEWKGLRVFKENMNLWEMK